MLIYGNTAQRGGGIGSNGTVITGEEGTQDVTVKKVWDTSANPDAVIPEKLTVYLVADGYRVDSVELSAANNWEHTFTGLPDNVTLTFEESAPTGWTAQTPEVNGNVTTLTNKADAPVTPTPTPEKPGKKRKHRTPYTGDASVVAMVAFATVGAGFVGVGAYARTRKDQ